MTRRHEVDIAKYFYEQPDHYTVRDCLIDYSRERLIAKGKDCLRAWCGFNYLMEIVPPDQDVTKINIGQIEDFVDYRMTTCGSLLTPRRELSYVRAAIRNAHRRNRIGTIPYIELPEEQSKARRPLSEAEFRLVISKPMSLRLRKFYWTAYYTGHRSRAIEELTWNRVRFGEKPAINFNVPGRIVTNKRRANAFPIPDDFLSRLVAWKERATDEYVIGLGPRGALSNTYKEADYVVRELCGLTDPTLVPRHCMRSMFATECFERGADPEVVGKIMADAPGTLRRNYVKFKHETLLEVANLRTRPMECVETSLQNRR